MSRRRMSVGIVLPTCGSPPRSTDTGRWVVTYFRAASERARAAGEPTVGTAEVVVVSTLAVEGAADTLFGAAWSGVGPASNAAEPLGARKREAIQPSPP